MALSIAALCLSCVSVVICTATNAKVRLGKFAIHLYWVVPFVCAVVLVATSEVPAKQVAEQFFGDSDMNPLKTLAIFLSMSAMSVYLDRVGFFKYLAAKIMKHAGTSQLKLFVLLYIIISLITLVTSNSTIVLTFTPFICYFAKNSNINPVPYVFMEYVAANTWSMFLMIGNTTNVYVATYFGVGFMEYVAMMAVPTIFAAAVSFALLLLMFRKDLKAPLSASELEVSIRNVPALVVGVTGLGVCTVLLIASSYISVPMWLICLCSATAVMLAAIICFLAKKQSLHPLAKTAKRMPWHLVPFLLSMFVVVLSLMNNGITDKIAAVFDNEYSLWSFGALSAAASNLMNNLPMSMFFVGILSEMTGAHLTEAMFATVIGSNMGSLFTPVASMSAIMWMSIIKHKGVQFRFKQFVKKGVLLTLPTLAAALGGLTLMMAVMPA